MRKTWKEKLFNPPGKFPRIIQLTPKQAKVFGRGSLVIPHPLDYDKAVRKVSKGKLVTINILRAKLARKYKVENCCPITAGIFVSILAHYAQEQLAEGKKRVTPFWRVLKEGGVLNEKFPGGVDAQSAYLKTEGFKLEKTGKRTRVVDYKRYLMKA
jgi:hypothetical protein